MPSGGARMNSGPPPSPNGRNAQRDSSDWTTIPQRNGTDANGVAFDVPSWPSILGHPEETQQEFWNDLWMFQPQAVVWERERMHAQVAQYVMAFLDYTVGPRRMSPERGALVARLADQILMTPAALRSARIVVAGSKDAELLAAASASAAQNRSGGSRSGRAGLSVVKPA